MIYDGHDLRKTDPSRINDRGGKNGAVAHRGPPPARDHHAARHHRPRAHQDGSVIYDRHDLRMTDPSRIVTMGLAHVPEGRQVFTRMTVAENLAMGAYFPKDKKAIADDLERVYARFPRLKERAKQLAGTLSGGEQQMLAMGRAIMSAPKLIVMDEPSMGLSPVLVQEVFSIIGTMHELGITILLVEQNAKMALAIADRAYVLENGRITMSGGARDLLHDDKVRRPILARGLQTEKAHTPAGVCAFARLPYRRRFFTKFPEKGK